MNEIGMYSLVMTPRGQGIVQGVLHQEGKPDQLLVCVSRSTSLIKLEEGQELVGQLFAYLPETLKPITIDGRPISAKIKERV